MILTRLSRWFSGALGLLVALTLAPRARAAVIQFEVSLQDTSTTDFVTLATNQTILSGAGTGNGGEAVSEFMPNFAQAMRSMEKSRALDVLSDPDALQVENSAAFSALISAQMAFNEGDYKKAIAFAREALKVDSAEARAHFMLGSSMLALGNRDEAREALALALRIEPDYPEAMSNLAVLRYQDGETDAAILLLIHALEKNVSYVSAWRNYVSIVSKEILPTGNLPDLPTPSAENPEEKLTPARWHWREAIRAMDAQDAQLAARHFLQSLTLNINDPNTHNDFGVFLQRVDRRLLALPFLRAAAHLSPGAPLVRKNLDDLARGLHRESLEQQAETLTGKLAVAQNAADHLALARILRDLEREDTEIIDHLRKAAALAPGDVSYRVELINTLARLQRHREAIDVLRPTLRADPNNPRWHLRMARLLKDQPDPDAADLAQAVDNARRACELTQFERKDALLLLAELFDAVGEKDDANTARRRAQEL